MAHAKTKSQWLFQVNEIVSAINKLDDSLQHGSTQKCQEVSGSLRCIDKDALYNCLENLKQVSEFIQETNHTTK